METLYSALQDEICAFEAHVQSCQKDFDLHTLYNVLLLLLPGSPTWEVKSLEQLEKLVEGRAWPGQDTVKITGSAESCDVPGYVAWLGSYLGYLNTLKETFDAKVVFPLCEHLYVHEELDAGAERRSPVGSHNGSGAGHSGEKRPHTVTSITDIAKKLFAVRRKWALLLNRGVIDDRVFSPQSLCTLRGFANTGPIVKVLRLVPDIFHKSLAMAALASQWLSLHGSRYSIFQLLSEPGQEKGERRTGLAAGTSEPWRNGVAISLPESASGCSSFSGGRVPPRPRRSSSSCSSHDGGGWLGSVSATQTKLRESREELMALLWRVERAGVLETQLHELTQSISRLQLEQQDTRRKLDVFQQRLEQADWDVPDSIPLLRSQCQATLRELEDQGRHMELEKYRKSILQSDWLLELELRPGLIRQLDALQQRCRELEQSLQAKDQAALQHLLPASRTDSASLCDSGHCSTVSPMPTNKA
ncbi:uncharacterized protein LOC127059037 [Gopherus flavomarginatus]|uniref:uncharacterized protein LOC127059037 n=1 Tax=Gopherus flavomarginatus TaxID=286002 RepID=UPI0021CB9F8C|nr:uncharacterized protein LOC127059037 [Gopherus flavomarginatus]XP_050825633.1 uncharacterized protein LOC127059037 [Gopherus flavomarginatus]